MDNQIEISPSEKEALVKEFRDLEEIKTREAKSRAVVLEILGDIPDADITPPKNVLFVCKLNPVTEEGDLKIIFSRFGTVKKCDIIKDYVTGDSLQYAFIEFENEESCNEAYFKMQNVLIDDRRIHVDFCQSVSGFWKRYFFKENFTKKTKNLSDHRRYCYKSDKDPYRKHHHRRSRSDSQEKDSHRRTLSSSPEYRHRKHSSRHYPPHHSRSRDRHRRSRSPKRDSYRRYRRRSTSDSSDYSQYKRSRRRHSRERTRRSYS